MKVITSIIVALFLAACGGGGSDAPPTVPQPVEQVTAPVEQQYVFWGNSLTKVPFDVDYIPGYLDWGQGGWGMAASEPSKDFVHIVSTAKGVPFVALNLANNERDPGAALPSTPITVGTTLFLQLGDNGLPARYGELLAAGKNARQIICVSTWGYDLILRQRDAVMRSLCLFAGATWVDISDIFPTRQDDIGRYGHPGVDAHPHDWAMAEIARRLLAAIRR